MNAAQHREALVAIDEDGADDLAFDLDEDMDADDETAPTWGEAVGPIEFWGAKA